MGSLQNGKIRDASKERNIPWLEFSEENVLWVGEGTKDKKRVQWMLGEDNSHNAQAKGTHLDY